MSGPQRPGYEAEFEAELPSAVLSLALGGTAAAVALLGQLGFSRGLVAWVDLPLTLVLFLLDVAVMLRAAQRGGGGLPGLLLAGVALLVAACGLLLRRDHPWLG